MCGWPSPEAEREPRQLPIPIRSHVSSSFVAMSSLFAPSQATEATQRAQFLRLKAICVPLAAATDLQPGTTQTTVSQLDQLVAELGSANTRLSLSIISYVFLPVSTILRRNALVSIPDTVLERILRIIGILARSWWFSADPQTWEQLFKFVAIVLVGGDPKGKGRALDEPCQLAAASALHAILGGDADDPDEEHADRLTVFRPMASVPEVANTLDALLALCGSPNMELQLVALRAIYLLVRDYQHEDVAPTVLPGVVTAMVRCAVGADSHKGWSNGEVVAAALDVIVAIIKAAIGDEACIRAGAIRRVDDLSDLAQVLSEEVETRESQRVPGFTMRTQSWVRGSATQLHIALNSLTPLVSHNNAIALRSLASNSLEILSSTKLTLPQSQPLLLSFLLALSQSEYESVAKPAHVALVAAAKDQQLMQHILHLAQDALASLSRHLNTHADTRLTHRLRLIRAVCALAPDIPAIPIGIGQLLGAKGGIEKWGVGLLASLIFVVPSSRIGLVPNLAGLLEGGSDDNIVFPQLPLQFPADSAVQALLEDTLTDLGRAGGVECLYAVEWLVAFGAAEYSARATAALWCAALIADGAADSSRGARGKLAKTARWMAKAMSELWQTREGDEQPALGSEVEQSSVEFSSGLIKVDTSIMFPTPAASDSGVPPWSPFLHRAAALRVIAAASNITGVAFAPVLMHALYPLLHSLVSSSGSLLLHNTSLAALEQVARATGYASSRNMLLANFDYALTGAAARLLRAKLDIEAARVLRVLVRLVGGDVVERMGDVVEECFERLDEYHGYEILVERLVEVLGEVVTVVRNDALARGEMSHGKEHGEPTGHVPSGELVDIIADATVDKLLDWIKIRHQPPSSDLGNNEDDEDEPLPRRSWKNKGHDHEHQHERGSDTDKHEHEHEGQDQAPPPRPKSPERPKPTATHNLIHLIISRSIPLLTHSSALIRTRILGLMSPAAAFLGAYSNDDDQHPAVSLLLPQIHRCWPFVLNRLQDRETFVVAAAATFVASLAESRGAGDFVKHRLWTDVWPQFKKMLGTLRQAEKESALMQRQHGMGPNVDPMASYATSTKLHIAMLRTLDAAVRIPGLGGTPDKELWDVANSFVRFLDAGEEDGVQAAARRLFVQLKRQNADAVWLVLSGALGECIGEQWPASARNSTGLPPVLRRSWDIAANANLVFSC